MDFGRHTPKRPGRRETIMASLLDHNFPLVPSNYDPDTFTRIFRDLEMALTKIDFPAVVSGEDDANGLSWFME